MSEQNQDTFNAVVAHARKQKSRAYDERDRQCVYRMRDGSGRKCFAGALIPDELYDLSLEGEGNLTIMDDLGAARVMPTKAGGILQRLGHDLLLVGALQRVHDMSEPPHWEERLAAVAAEWCLDFTKQ